MGRLDCKEPSLLALDALARDADMFMTVSEEDAAQAVALLARHGVRSSPSGAAGLAGLAVAMSNDDGTQVGLDDRSRVLLYVSEGEVDA
jgi:diaminopropionate ammonia-lyase